MCVCVHAETVPECHVFQALNTAVRQEDAADAARRFSLCLRPDAAQVSRQNPSAALVTCITPSSQRNGVSLRHVSSVTLLQVPKTKTRSKIAGELLSRREVNVLLSSSREITCFGNVTRFVQLVSLLMPLLFSGTTALSFFS